MSRPAAGAQSPAVARAPSIRRLASAKGGAGAGGGEVTIDEVLTASGVQHADAVLFSSLPSGYYARLAPSLAQLCNLRELDVSSNELQDVSPLAPLPCLFRLSVGGNPLARWPAVAGGFAALEILDCSFTHLQPAALQALAALPRLRQLDISGAGLRALPPLSAATPSPFPELRRLVAGHNELDGAALAALAPLPALQQLALPDNRIRSVPPLDGAVAFLRLDMLDLSHNRVADVAAVQRLQALPSLQRLLLAGNPVAGAGFGASGTLASTLHGHGGQRRGSIATVGPAAVSGAAAKPARPQGLQFVAVEEASVVCMKAKALTQQRRAAAAAAAALPAVAAAGVAGAAPGTLPPPYAEAPDAAAATEAPAAGAAECASAAAASGSTDAAGASADAANAVAGNVRAASAADPAAPSNSTSDAGVEAPPPASTAPEQSAARPCFLDWDLAGEDDDELGLDDSVDYMSCTDSQGQLWSVQSTGGTAATAASTAADYEGFSWVEDPTVRAALGLGLDPLKLPLLGGPASRGGNPNAAIKALRFALAHPAPAPSSDGIAGGGSGSHLRLTKSTLAKQRQKAGAAAAAAQAGGVQGRVATIDVLLAAMKRRLAAVQAAMEAQPGEPSAAAEGQGGSASEAPAAAAPVSGAGHEYNVDRARRATALYLREAATAALPLLHA
ncbi:hypothetical protein ABPG75_000620 [Micractinium tetrahymenae]